MTESLPADGPEAVRAAGPALMGEPRSGSDAMPGVRWQTALIDRVIDLLVVLEPFEIKQGGAPLPPDGADSEQCVRNSANEAQVASGPAAEAVQAPPDERTGTGSEATGAGPGPGRESAALHSAEREKPSVESTTAMLGRMRAVLDREAARLGEDGLEGKAAVDQVALIARTLEKIDQMERLIAEDQARAMGERLSGAEREQMRRTVRQLILAAAERLVAERASEVASDAAAAGTCEVNESCDPADARPLDQGSAPGLSV